MQQSGMKTFREFWPFYVREHGRPATRALHAAGTITGTALFVALAATGRWRWLPAALVPGYAAAWAGHYFIEHNRPATFKHPLWSLAGDYKMVALMLAGRMGEEVRRAHAPSDAGAHAPSNEEAHAPSNEEAHARPDEATPVRPSEVSR